MGKREGLVQQRIQAFQNAAVSSASQSRPVPQNSPLSAQHRRDANSNPEAPALRIPESPIITGYRATPAEVQKLEETPYHNTNPYAQSPTALHLSQNNSLQSSQHAPPQSSTPVEQRTAEAATQPVSVGEAKDNSNDIASSYSYTPVTNNSNTPSAHNIPSIVIGNNNNMSNPPSIVVEDKDTAASMYVLDPTQNMNKNNNMNNNNDKKNISGYVSNPFHGAYSFDPLNPLSIPEQSSYLISNNDANRDRRASFYQMDASPAPELYQLKSDELDPSVYLQSVDDIDIMKSKMKKSNSGGSNNNSGGSNNNNSRGNSGEDKSSEQEDSDNDSSDGGSFVREGMGEELNRNGYDSAENQNNNNYDPELQEGGHNNNRGQPRELVEIMFGEELRNTIQKPLTGSSRDWNAEYQSILDLPDSKNKYKKLKSLATDFVYAAETYGRIIISENCVPISAKTIRPVSVGGIAGGEKYIVSGILFKFCVDVHGLYNGDHNAMKAASHELKGLQQYYYSGIDEIRVPLMAYIDYRGWRLQAISLLPISSNSLVYGSCDGGRTLMMENEAYNNYMKRAAGVMNIKGHNVGPDGRTKEIFSCCDIEGHQGNDGRFYLLDFARVAPSQPPKAKGENLYNLFRFEFLRNYSVPLSSDVHSLMGRHNSLVHSQEAADAYNHLLKHIIPEVAENIDNNKIESIKDILTFMHRKGVNYRFLGHIRSLVKDEQMKSSILYECIARVCSMHVGQILRSVSRRSGTPSNEPFNEAVISLFNIIIGKDVKSAEYYRLLRVTLDRKYPLLVGRDEELPIGENMDRSKLFNRILELTSIVMAHGSLKNIKNSVFEFVQPDILDMKTQVAHLNLVEFADGMFLYHEAQERQDEDGKLRLLNLAQTKLKSSINSMICNEVASIQMGNMFYMMAKVLHSKNQEYKEAIQDGIQIFKNLQEAAHTDEGLKYIAYEMEAKLLKRSHIWSGVRDNEPWEQVVEVCQKAIKLNPQAREVYILLAKIYLRRHGLEGKNDDSYLQTGLKYAQIAEDMILKINDNHVAQLAQVLKIQIQLGLQLLHLDNTQEDVYDTISSEFQELAQINPPIAAKLASKINKYRDVKNVIVPLRISRESHQLRGMVLAPLMVDVKQIQFEVLFKSPVIKDEDLITLSSLMPSLQILDLRSFSGEQSTCISIVSARNQLRQISVDNNIHSSTILAMSKACNTIVEWKIYDHATMCDEHMDEFFKEIGGRLESLWLNNVQDIGSPSCTSLSRYCTKLNRLELESCGAMDDLSNVLSSNQHLSKLKILKLRNCKSLTTGLLEGLKGMSNIEIMDMCGSVGMDVEASEKMMNMIPTMKKWRLPNGHTEVLNDQEMKLGFGHAMPGSNTINLTLNGGTIGKVSIAQSTISAYNVVLHSSSVLVGDEFNSDCTYIIQKNAGPVLTFDVKAYGRQLCRIGFGTPDSGTMFRCQNVNAVFSDDAYSINMTLTRNPNNTTGNVDITRKGFGKLNTTIGMHASMIVPVRSKMSHAMILFAATVFIIAMKK